MLQASEALLAPEFSLEGQGGTSGEKGSMANTLISLALYLLEMGFRGWGWMALVLLISHSFFLISEQMESLGMAND